MNQFFNFKRFSLLVSKHWADNKKRYGLAILAYIGVLTAWLKFTIFTDDHGPLGSESQLVAFSFSFFFAGTLYASQYFSDLSSRPKGSNFLLVPASVFEKILCSLLYTVVLFIAVLVPVFYLVDSLVVTLVNSFPTMAAAPGKASVVNIFDAIIIQFGKETTFNILLVFLSLQSAFIFGSVYFKKYNFIKTSICVFVIWVLCFAAIYLTRNHPLLDDNPPTQAFFLIIYAIAPLLWIVTYYQLKAKQV